MPSSGVSETATMYPYKKRIKNININPNSVLVRVLLLWTDTVTKASLINKEHLIGASLQFQRFSPLSSRWKHGSNQAGMAHAELRVLHLHPKTASGRLTSRELGWGSYAHTDSDTPGHTYSNKATPTNVATPWSKNIQTITFHSLAPINLFKHMSLCGGEGAYLNIT